MTAVIAGIGRTRFTTGADVSSTALAAEAIRAAVDDARITWEHVDGVVRFDRVALWEYDLPGVMRLPALHYYGAVPDAPGSGPALVRLAAMAVTLGLASVVVGYHARAEPRSAPAGELALDGVKVEAGDAGGLRLRREGGRAGAWVLARCRPPSRAPSATSTPGGPAGTTGRCARRRRGSSRTPTSSPVGRPGVRLLASAELIELALADHGSPGSRPPDQPHAWRPDAGGRRRPGRSARSGAPAARATRRTRVPARVALVAGLARADIVGPVAAPQ
jgi:hypothetical protein